MNTKFGEKIGFIGLGKLGMPCAEAIAKKGFDVAGYDTVKKSTTLGKVDAEVQETVIGDGVYIGPNSIIQKGVTIGDKAVIGAMSFVNKNVPSGARFYGVPARELG